MIILTIERTQVVDFSSEKYMQMLHQPVFAQPGHKKGHLQQVA